MCGLAVSEVMLAVSLVSQLRTLSLYWVVRSPRVFPALFRLLSLYIPATAPLQDLGFVLLVLWELCLLTGEPGFYVGAGICTLPEGDWEDGQGHPGHVPREGHSGSVSERGLCLHRSPSDRG